MARDWLDYATSIAAFFAAVLSGVAIGYAAWQASATKKMLVKERRTEFELGLLAEIRRQMSITGFQHLAGYVGALIRSSEDETDIPVLRATIGVKAGERGRAAQADIRTSAQARGDDVQGALLRECASEVDEAISRRLEA